MRCSLFSVKIRKFKVYEYSVFFSEQIHEFQLNDDIATYMHHKHGLEFSYVQ